MDVIPACVGIGMDGRERSAQGSVSREGSMREVRAGVLHVTLECPSMWLSHVSTCLQYT